MDAPAIIGFDGSPSARAAIAAARELVRATSVIVVTVWEPALPMPTLSGDAVAAMDTPIDLQATELLNEATTERSQHVADAGAEAARAVGFKATAVATPDEANVAETLAALARERGACAIVIGSHGHGALHTRVLGSTATSLLQRAGCPVVVVPRAQER